MIRQTIEWWLRVYVTFTIMSVFSYDSSNDRWKLNADLMNAATDLTCLTYLAFKLLMRMFRSEIHSFLFIGGLHGMLLHDVSS